MKEIFKLFLLLLVNIQRFHTFEDKNFFEKFSKHRERVAMYSNNTITLGANSEKGFHYIANDYIERGEIIMKIPKKLSLCSYYMFPFKFELVKILLEYDKLTHNNYQGKFRDLSNYLLSFYLLFHMTANKEQIKTYILEKKLVRYYNCSEPDDSMIDLFPNLLNFPIFREEHYNLLKWLGYPTQHFEEMEKVYKFVGERLLYNDHARMIIPWISNYKQFKMAFSIVISRGISIHFDQYYILDQIQEKQSKLNKWEKMNLQYNKELSVGFGMKCLIAYFDLFNYHHPKNIDLTGQKKMNIGAISGYFINTFDNSVLKGEEVSHTFTEDFSNIILLYNFGFIIPNNIFNLVNMKIEYKTQLTLQQFKLCKELGCVEPSIADPKNLPINFDVFLKLNSINDKLINYGRVKQLTDNFDQKSIIKTISNEEFVSYENEISALLFYYKNCLNVVQKEDIRLERLLYNVQRYRNMSQELISLKKDNNQFTNWETYKIFENIYLMDISYKKIIFNNLNGSLKNIIFHSKNELDHIRTQYLSK